MKYFIIALRRPEGAVKGLNTETIKRFSDCDWYVLMEFSVALNLAARRDFCYFRLKNGI